MSSCGSMAGADQMRQYTERYDALKADAGRRAPTGVAPLQSLGFLFQGSLQTRRIACGKTTCSLLPATRTPGTVPTTTGHARTAGKPSG